MYSVIPNFFFSRKVFFDIGPFINLFVNPFLINSTATEKDLLIYTFDFF